jgi:hypothetical protein
VLIQTKAAMSSKGGKKSYKSVLKGTSANPKIINANRKVDKKRTDLRDKATINRLQVILFTIIFIIIAEMA